MGLPIMMSESFSLTAVFFSPFSSALLSLGSPDRFEASFFANC